MEGNKIENHDGEFIGISKEEILDGINIFNIDEEHYNQFPLNMFRGQAKSFKTEDMAVEVALNAINNGYDEELSDEKLLFLFMPLMHSENIDHQNLQVYLFQKYNFNLEFSKHHRDIIKKFGRFPHRNEIFGRMSTMEELDYLLSDNAFRG